MFCPNCGTDCKNANFCLNCGTDLRNGVDALSTTPSFETESAVTYPSLDQPYICKIGVKEVDLHKVIKTYGMGIRKGGAYAFLVSTCGITNTQAHEVLDPLYDFHKNESTTFMQSFEANKRLVSNSNSDEKAQRSLRIQEMDEAGWAYCPKCLSTSISANQKGFGFARGALGAAVGLDVGMLAGGIGSKKVVCTCLKCGHKWTPGKK